MSSVLKRNKLNIKMTIDVSMSTAIVSGKLLVIQCENSNVSDLFLLIFLYKYL